MFLNLILIQPLDQFEFFIINIFLDNYIYNIFTNNIFSINFLISTKFISNSLLYLIYILFIVNILFNIILFNKTELFNFALLKVLLETFFYIFIINIFLSHVGKLGKEYFPYIFSLFIFILFSNFLGLIPLAFTVTSHILVTFLLGGFSIIGLTILGFINQKLKFLYLFIPKGVPILLMPLLIIIEIISYIARGFSLSIRLFANIMSGHALIHILLFFIIKILSFNFKLGFISIIIISIIFLLEVGISFLQAYVFIVLISIYFKDSYIIEH